MSRRRLRRVCFFGGYDATYPRNRVLKLGLESLEIDVCECRAIRWRRSFARYGELVWRYTLAGACRESPDVVFVPEFGHKDVPLAAALAWSSGALCVFDPLVSRYDTKIFDRRDASLASFQAWHNHNLDRWSMTLPDVVIADTGAHARYFREQFRSCARDVDVVPVGYDETQWTAEPPSPGREGHDVLFYGSYLPLHGVLTIVEAAALLRGRRDIRFEVIGGGQTYAGVERRVAELDLENLRLSPRVKPDDMPLRVRSATVCLGIFGDTPKAGRVVPNKVYQCMGMGKPVVTRRSDAVAEAFAGDDVLVTVPPADPTALALAVESLCDDARLRAEVGRKAARRAVERFSSVPVARRFVEACERGLGGKGG